MIKCLQCGDAIELSVTVIEADVLRAFIPAKLNVICVECAELLKNQWSPRRMKNGKKV